MNAVENCLTKTYLDFNKPTVQKISKGLENQNYRISTDDKDYLFRVYSIKHSTTGKRDIKDIEEELRFINYLREQGIPTPQVIKGKENQMFTTIILEDGIHFACLFNYVKGVEVDTYNSKNSASVAKILLAMISASSKYRYSYVRKWGNNMIEQSLALFESEQQKIVRYHKELEHLYNETRNLNSRLQTENISKGLIHGDVKLENLLFKGNKVIAVLDFDDYHEGYFLEELVRTIMHDLDSKEKNVLRSGNLVSFLKVFETDPQYLQKEIKYLTPLMKARFLYDVTSYSVGGYYNLVEELFADKNIKETILSEDRC